MTILSSADSIRCPNPAVKSWRTASRWPWAVRPQFAPAARVGSAGGYPYLGKIGPARWADFCVAEWVRRGAGVIAGVTAADMREITLAGFRHLPVSTCFPRRGLRPGLTGVSETAGGLGLTVSLDPGRDPAGKWDLPSISMAIAHCGMLFVNKVELRGVVEKGLRALSDCGRNIVATIGKKGCSAVYAGGELCTAGRWRDATGAGDSFTAGFLYAGLRGLEAADRRRSN